MTAWQRLLAASSLALGSAWQLISSPRTGGSGTVLVSDAAAIVDDTSVSAAVADTALAVFIDDRSHTAQVQDGLVAVYVSDDYQQAIASDTHITGTII